MPVDVVIATVLFVGMVSAIAFSLWRRR